MLPVTRKKKKTRCLVLASPFFRCVMIVVRPFFSGSFSSIVVRRHVVGTADLVRTETTATTYDVLFPLFLFNYHASCFFCLCSLVCFPQVVPLLAELSGTRVCVSSYTTIFSFYGQKRWKKSARAMCSTASCVCCFICRAYTYRLCLPTSFLLAFFLVLDLHLLFSSTRVDPSRVSSVRPRKHGLRGGTTVPCSAKRRS